MNIRVILTVILMAAGTVFAQQRFTFEENPLPPESHWGGPGSAETGFLSGDWYFPHRADEYSWDGFVYSNRTDTTTPGYENQFSAITGSGVNGSAHYGICYIPSDWMSGTYDPIPQYLLAVTDGESVVCPGFYVTNTTYVYYAVRDGDWFSRKFGGEAGDEPDYLKLIIRGVDAEGNYTGVVEFYLADYRFEDNNLDYIVDQWTWVDTASLGPIAGLEFVMESSDVGNFGINTPTYFAIDNLPEPATAVLLAVGAMAVLARRKKR